MTSLFVDRKGVELTLDGDVIVFRLAGERIGTVPLAPLTRVYLRGDVQLQSSVLGRLGERGIGVVVLSGRLGKPTLLLSTPHNDAQRRIAQLQLAQDLAFCLSAARVWVTEKLTAQRRLLELHRDHDFGQRYELTQRVHAIDSALAACAMASNCATLRGVEGSAAAAFFAGFAAILPGALSFHGRNRRPPRDPVNALLSLSYTLLHSEAVLATYGAGLDPFVGFYHAIDFGRESLACDLVEPLRPLADEFVLGLFRSETLRADHFSQTHDGCLLGKAGRARYYEAAELLLEQCRRALERSAGALVRWVTQGHVDGAPVDLGRPAA
jgi:CRISP-associated protein Cas1